MNEEVIRYLEQALEAAEDDHVRRHIREALQMPAVQEGEIDAEM